MISVFITDDDLIARKLCSAFTCSRTMQGEKLTLILEMPAMGASVLCRECVCWARFPGKEPVKKTSFILRAWFSFAGTGPRGHQWARERQKQTSPWLHLNISRWGSKPVLLGKVRSSLEHHFPQVYNDAGRCLPARGYDKLCTGTSNLTVRWSELAFLHLGNTLCLVRCELSMLSNTMSHLDTRHFYTGWFTSVTLVVI